MRRLVLASTVSFALLFGACFVGHQFVYGPFVLPRLASFRGIPLVWWVAMAAPAIATLIGLGLWLRRPVEFLLSSTMGAAGVFAFTAWASARLEPGFQKSALLGRPDPLSELLGAFAIAGVCLWIQVMTRAVAQRHSETRSAA
jgi:hypothetical protein